MKIRKMVDFEDVEFVFSEEKAFELVFHEPEWEIVEEPTKDL